MSDKLITMKEYNGSSYDALYPENTSGQVNLDASAQNILNLSTDTTLNDAFTALTTGGGYSVGDVLVTARTDLDDRWLLCNGQEFDSAEYPALNGVLGQSVSVLDSSRWSTVTYDGVLGNRLYYCGGRFYAVTRLPSTEYLTSNYKKDSYHGDSWSSVVINNSKYYILHDMCDVNGVAYAAISQNSYSSRETPYLYKLDENNNATMIGSNISVFGMCEYNGKILISNNGVSLVDPSTGAVTTFTSSSLGDGDWFHVGNMVYCVNKVLDLQTKTISALSTTGTGNSFGYYNGYYYMSSSQSVYDFQTKQDVINIHLLQSSDGVTFTSIYNRTISGSLGQDAEDPHLVLFIIGDELLFDTNIYKLTDTGAQLISSSNSHVCNCAAMNNVNVSNEKSIVININERNGSGYSTVYLFNRSGTKTPTWTPAGSLYAYIKAKR